MGQTDGRTLDRYIDPAPAYCAGSVSNNRTMFNGVRKLYGICRPVEIETSVEL